MRRALDFLKECGTFYIATLDGDQPRVRPFGAVMGYEGKLYICTNNTKKCFKQMDARPKIEICALNKNMKWIRIAGEIVADPSDEARKAMLKENEVLNNMYKIGDGIFEVLYFKSAKAEIYTMGGLEEEFSF